MIVGKKENTIKILIVEDSPTQAEKLKHILEEQGHQVIHAMNGRDALAILNDQMPNLVISDIIMPEMDGFELCRNIKADERLRSTPVILLTSLSDPQDVIKAVQCGADQFVTKPYDEQHLLTTVEHLLHDKNQHDREENQKGIHISYRDENFLITSHRRQILNLLLSIYEAAISKNRDLIKTQYELKSLNDDLEEIVNKRTATLHSEIAERKSAEAALQAKNEELNTVLQQLWQAAKLATVGELASSIAHELNNPLATISLRIESLTAKTPEDDPRRRELEIVGQEVERMGNLVTNLLQFSRRSQQQISTMDVREEIEKTFELIEYHLRKNNIKVIREFAPDVPFIHADRQQLRQLFLNLFTNAGDAMPQGGTLTVRVYVQGSGIRGQESGVEPAPEPRPPSPAVVIEIADTGVGIPPEILPKVMEAFFTTKPEGKGTGLGLAICRRVAQEHQGTFDIVSEGIPGKGTRVCIALPFSNGSNAKGVKGE
ncbi:MAG: hybrid sensor histidine kinase/response regulator [Syntrophales bacterium]